MTAYRTTDVAFLTEADLQEMEDGVWLLPAPLTQRHNLDNPTTIFDTMEMPGTWFRVGLARSSI